MFLSNRIDVKETPAEIRVVLTPRRNVFLWAFVTVWSAGWTLGGIAAIAHLIADPHDRLFIGVWLCGCAAAFFIGWSTWLWNGFGIERLLLTRESLKHERELFGCALTSKLIPASEIRTIRAIGPFGSPTLSREQLLFTTGTITMECAFDCFDFGYQLEEPEATALVELLHSFVSRSATNTSLRAKFA